MPLPNPKAPLLPPSSPTPSPRFRNRFSLSKPKDKPASAASAAGAAIVAGAGAGAGAGSPDPKESTKGLRGTRRRLSVVSDNKLIEGIATLGVHDECKTEEHRPEHVIKMYAGVSKKVCAEGGTREGHTGCRFRGIQHPSIRIPLLPAHRSPPPHHPRSPHAAPACVVPCCLCAALHPECVWVPCLAAVPGAG
jgi:hypothetical protein